MKLDLQPSQPDWTKVCGKDQTANKEICYTTRDFGTQADQPPVLALAVYDVKGDDTKVVRLLVPVGLMLRPGFRFSVDKGPLMEGGYEICFPNGCFGEAKVKTATIDAMKKGTTLSVIVKNQVNAEVNFNIPLANFGKAYDGPAIDPKVLEEQQKKLQEELQKRADEERKKLESSQAGAATGGAAAPTDTLRRQVSSSLSLRFDARPRAGHFHLGGSGPRRTRRLVAGKRAATKGPGRNGFHSPIRCASRSAMTHKAGAWKPSPRWVVRTSIFSLVALSSSRQACQATTPSARE